MLVKNDWLGLLLIFSLVCVLLCCSSSRSRYTKGAVYIVILSSDKVLFYWVSLPLDNCHQRLVSIFLRTIVACVLLECFTEIEHLGGCLGIVSSVSVEIIRYQVT